MRDLDTVILRVKADLPITDDEIEALRSYLDERQAARRSTRSLISAMMLVATLVLIALWAVGFFDRPVVARVVLT